MAGPLRRDLSIIPPGLSNLPQDLRAYLQNNPLEVAAASNTTYAPYERVRPLQVKQGAVLFLPDFDSAIDNHRRRAWNDGPIFVKEKSGLKNREQFPEDYVYRHPLLVLSRPAHDPETIYFCLMTTFGTRSVEERFDNESKTVKWQYYLAVDPSEEHPIELYPTLYYDYEAKTKRSGYVRTNVVYSMNYADAVRFHDGNQPKDQMDSRVWQITSKSMETVLSHVRCHASWEPQHDEHQPSEQDFQASLRICLSHGDWVERQRTQALPEAQHRPSAWSAPAYKPKSDLSDTLDKTDEVNPAYHLIASSDADSDDADTSGYKSDDSTSSAVTVESLSSVQDLAPTSTTARRRGSSLNGDAAEFKPSSGRETPRHNEGGAEARKVSPLAGEFISAQQLTGQKDAFSFTTVPTFTIYDHLLQSTVPFLQKHKYSIMTLSDHVTTLFRAEKFGLTAKTRDTLNNTTVLCLAGRQQPFVAAAVANKCTLDSILHAI